ncbi:PilZ domain-containing protein [Bdellovibrio sp. NC01]|nr:PilZ domain-containing protein [Bdellovibrio sp. NC01]
MGRGPLIFVQPFRKDSIAIISTRRSNVEDTVKVPAPRTPLNLEVSFKRNYAREETIGTLKNISITGAFLEFSGGDVRTNEKLNLFFVVAGRERKIAAQVIWINSAGVGIKFMPTNNRDVQIVDDLIYFVENGRTEARSVMDSIFKKVG